MRWASVALALLCVAGAGRPQDGGGRGDPVFRCRSDRAPGGARLEDSGVAWLDQRIRSERGFLASLFGVKPDFVLLGGDAPRIACVARDAAGGATVAFRAAWLVEHCSEAADHRTARTAYALAHQYAHVLQWKRGCTLPEISRELHADLLAGWYLGKRNIATLRGDPPLDAGFQDALFRRPDPWLNDRFEHGTAEARRAALAEGFRLYREDKLGLKQVYELGLVRYPPPNVGLAGAGPRAPVPPILEAALKKVKRECTHRGPCRHPVPCRHPKPCVHKVACSHFAPCVHRVPCTHQIPCTHHVPCVHRVECKHRVPCVHTVPCRHTKHSCDFDENGRMVPCVHFLHRFDYLHNFDYAHDFDYAHEFDTAHEFDLAHESDPAHEDGDPVHEFDFAHEWDPVHDHDLAHEWDPVHDYDVQVLPKGPADYEAED